LNVRFQGGVYGTYPRPNYDSGWRVIGMGDTTNLVHNLGGDPDNYVVDLQFNTSTAYGHNQGSGVWTDFADRDVGATWRSLTTTNVVVYRATSDSRAEEIRLRIWVYQ